MEGELQELRDLVVQLRAENDRLQREQAAAVPGPSAAPSIPTESLPAPSTTSAPVAERLILVPRDRRCPVFRGSGMHESSPPVHSRSGIFSF